MTFWVDSLPQGGLREDPWLVVMLDWDRRCVLGRRTACTDRSEPALGPGHPGTFADCLRSGHGLSPLLRSWFHPLPLPHHSLPAASALQGFYLLFFFLSTSKNP